MKPVSREQIEATWDRLCDLNEKQSVAFSQKFLKALIFYQAQGDRHLIGRTLVNLGLYAGYEGRYELAIERLRDLVGTVLDPRVHRALQAVVARREALIFLDDGRG